MGGIALVPAKADVWDQRTVVTFSAPVEIPGRVLPAGTYTMTLARVPSNRNLVQFWNKNGTRLIEDVQAIPQYRSKATGQTEFTFEERAANAPPAIKTWYFPWNHYGQELVYGKARSTMTSQNVGSKVPAYTTEPAQ